MQTDLAEDVVNDIRNECATSSVDSELVVSVMTVPNRFVGERLCGVRKGGQGRETSDTLSKVGNAKFSLFFAVSSSPSIF